MATVSLCMIVKNEEEVLDRCLQSVKHIVDEIIIVDTGSTDDTKEIAKKFDAKIYDFEWCNDFSKARNYSFSLASKDYILWLDADDIIEEKEQLKFIKLKESLSEEIDAVSMPYILSVNESGDVDYQIRRNRLTKRKRQFKWEGKVHEVLLVSGNILHSDVAIKHKKGKLKILIGSPIKQDSDILIHFLYSLENLEKSDEVQVNYLFFDDNDDMTSKKLLKKFSTNREVSIIETNNKYEYIKDDLTHYWTSNNVQHVSWMKNHILNYSKDNDFDYVFLIDSDLVLHPKTLVSLLNANKDIISNIFWTKWTPDAIEMPQVWMQDEYQLFNKEDIHTLSESEMKLKSLEFILKLKVPGIYKVGGLGACTLISKKVINAGVNFNKIHNVSYAGEDRHFCIRAAVLGFSMYVETTYPAYHIYRKENLEEVEQWKSKNSFKQKGE